MLVLNGFYLVLSPSDGPFTPVRLILRAAPFQFKYIINEVINKMGDRCTGPMDKGDRQVICLNDPDGHLIEITAFCTKDELELEDLPLGAIRPQGRHSPDMWERFYKETPIDKMPWYSERLDGELEYYLFKFTSIPGRLLELGCGAGIQAARLAAIGYEVVGIDLAPDAVKYAKKNFEPLNPRLRFEVGDVTRDLRWLGQFDYVFDRGCFHTLAPEVRQDYVKNVAAVLKSDGILFLKTFSKKEPGQWGPYRFDGEELNRYFEDYFTLLDQEDTFFEGTLSQRPKGLLSVYKRR